MSTSTWKRGDILTPAELQLGDVIMRATTTIEQSDFATCVVIKVGEDNVRLFRPYAITLPTTSGVIPYVGHEEFSIFRHPHRPEHYTWILMQRKEIK